MKLIENIASSIHELLDMNIATYREISLITILIPLQGSNATGTGALLSHNYFCKMNATGLQIRY